MPPDPRFIFRRRATCSCHSIWLPMLIGAFLFCKFAVTGSAQTSRSIFNAAAAVRSIKTPVNKTNVSCNPVSTCASGGLANENRIQGLGATKPGACKSKRGESERGSGQFQREPGAGQPESGSVRDEAGRGRAAVWVVTEPLWAMTGGVWAVSVEVWVCARRDPCFRKGNGRTPRQPQANRGTHRGTGKTTFRPREENRRLKFNAKTRRRKAISPRPAKPSSSMKSEPASGEWRFD
jgi:hypothetical protein